MPTPWSAAVAVVATFAGLTLASTAGAASGTAMPTTVPTSTTSSSIPCVKVWNTNPPAYVEVCPPLASAE